MITFGDDRLPGRFWSKVREDPSGCWMWTASSDGQHGYGRYWAGGRLCRPYRHAYEVLVGPIAERLELDHLCRTPACVNPAHLEPVTHVENVRRGGASVRTHCPQGHPYDEANTYIRAHGHRGCRACHRAHVAVWNETQRQKRTAQRTASTNDLAA